MKTEDLQAQGLTKEQINFVMKENGIDLKAVQDDLSTAQNTITQLTNDKKALNNSLADLQGKLDKFKDVDVNELKGQIATLTSNLQAERDNAKKAEAKHALEKDVSEFLKDKQFVNDFTKNSIVSSLMDELDKDTAKGKSISDIFNSLVNGEDGKIKPNILVDQEQDKLNKNRSNFTTKFSNKQGDLSITREQFSKMSLEERTQLKETDPDTYDALRKRG